MNETLEVIKKRRSIRKFKSEQIGDKELEAIMEAAIYAPSGMNQQKWHFTVVQNKDILDRMHSIIKEGVLNSGIDFMVYRAKSPDFTIYYGAPTVVIITADEQARFIEIDCGAAAENIALAAESMNISSCFIGMSDFLFESEKADEIKKQLGIPEGHKFAISVALGYKDIEPPAPPKKKGNVNYIK